MMAERKSILLRVRPDLYEALQRWAQDEIRSVNGQIEYLLDQSLRQAGRAPRAAPAPNPPPDAGSEPEVDEGAG